MAEEGFFLGLGPWSNVYIGMGSPVCYPHINFLIESYNYELQSSQTLSIFEWICETLDIVNAICGYAK